MLIRRRQLWMTQKLFKKLLTSGDKRRELQEIPAAELQQFAIKFVQSFCLCNFFLKENHPVAWRNKFYFLTVKNNILKRAKPLENKINREIKIHVYPKRQTWLCTTWPSFSPYFPFTVYCFYTKISSFMPALSIRIALDCFYLLIFYSEKFSTDVCRLPYAVNVNLNLSNILAPPYNILYPSRRFATVVVAMTKDGWNGDQAKNLPTCS